MKKLGIIGGLGPMATVYFMQLLTQMSEAKTDQEHMEILLYSKPSIPDRTKYILGLSSESPIPDMISVGRELKMMGAEIIAIPCITAHFFHDELERGIGLPVINAIEETTAYLKERGISQVGILATDGTVESGLFQRTLEKKKIRSIMPDTIGQKKIMNIIYDQVKSGRPIDYDSFIQVSTGLFDQGAQVVLLACTELSMIKRDHELPAGYLDVMEVLAGTAVKSCNHLQNAYNELITK